MVRNFSIQDFPKTLLVLGNGFDLNCNLPSTYSQFLDYVLKVKTDISSKELEKMGNITVFDYCGEELDDYLNQINFAHDWVRNGYIVPELNPWYIIFLYKRLLKNIDWNLIESQIAHELSPDKTGLNIVEKIGDSLLGIKTEERVEYRAQNYSHIKTGTVDAVEKIYELLSYCLLHKDLRRLKLESSYEIYTELRSLVKELNLEYSEVVNFPQGPLANDMFELRISRELFPLVSKVLLAELKELEFDFSNYLKHSLQQMGSSYYDSAQRLTHSILNVCEDEEPYLEIESISGFNILSFNYTRPWERGGFRLGLFENVIKTINIHGIIDDTKSEDSDYEDIIFGIDDESILPSKNEYIFTKTSRTLDLYTDYSLTGISHEKLSDLLVPTIETIAFFGHSLSRADYSYFRMIFDKMIDNQNTKFIFVYNVFDGTTRDKQRRNLIQQISSLFGEYSIEKGSNTDIFRDLIQNNRIRLEEI